MSPRLTRGSSARPMNVPMRELGLSFYFETGAAADPPVVARLVTTTAAAIRRYLDDPISARTVGAHPDPQRNAFLAMFLAIDRVGFDPGTLSVMPLEPACQPKAHAGGTACPFCAVLHLVAAVGRERLLRVRAVAGEKDPKGRYWRATDLAIEPSDGLDEYRECIKRLSLPPLILTGAAPGGLTAAPAPESFAPGPAAALLGSIYAGSWKQLNFAVSSAGFRMGDIVGGPGDLGLDAAGWEAFRQLARGDGHCHPASLGEVDPGLAGRIEALSAALKQAFPQIPGEPLKASGSGGFEAEFVVHAEDQLS